ncbi:MAG TPA: type VI secretion protein IcmF/TssM N-terminal domain-containing protein [Alcaligenes sp.]|nr:type VI secretion protein IcmF/TssM N-terminal domain-containing protein [Alcaligenes sp.]HRL27891.1 type VI secretion protein IcmF/TssM N-terminal domain-containing protein [Alcaligenes sp.]
MLKRSLRVLGTLALLVVLAGLAWLYVMHNGWPLWAVVPLVLVALVLIWSALWLRRRWLAWRLRRRLARDMPRVLGSNHAAFDAQWGAGLQVLRQARLGGRRSSLYALPWMLSMDVGPCQTQDDYARLAVQSLPAAGPGLDQGVGWFFMKASVMMWAGPVNGADEPTAQEAAWSRLLHQLLRTRRREPLNGLVFNIDLPWLLQADHDQLQAAGKQMRARHDALARVFQARIPVWLMLQGGENVPGLSAWLQQLPPEVYDQALGYMVGGQGAEQGSLQFLAQAFESVGRRLAQLRIVLGQHGVQPPQVFELPERIAAQQAVLQNLLAPAFEATPYSATPLLRGLYWQVRTPHQAREGIAFARDVLDRILPSCRYGWQVFDRWSPWRRVLRHSLVLAWLLLCGLLASGLFYSSERARSSLQAFAVHHLPQLEARMQKGALDEDVQSLNIWRNAVGRLDGANHGLQAVLPFQAHVRQVQQFYKQRFVDAFRREILHGFLDPLIVQDLPRVSRSGSETEVAAWSQYLVRRINLVAGQLQGSRLEGRPLPGMELATLYGDSASRQVGLQTGVLLGQQYVDYLRWSPERVQLQSELDALQAALRQLGLRSRSPSWLLAWADFQNSIRPITLADFWSVQPDARAPVIAAGLTQTGTEAISDFVEELAEASGERSFWMGQSDVLEQGFRQLSYDAWYRFIVRFNDARFYLQTESDWDGALSSLYSLADPYARLFEAVDGLFRQVPAGERPAWVASMLTLQQLRLAARQAPAQGGVAGWLDQAQRVNALGHVGLRAVQQGESLAQSVQGVSAGLAGIEPLHAYQTQLADAIKRLLQGPGSAQELARQTWGFGQDPQVQDSLLHDAQNSLDALRAQLQRDTAREDAVWSLMRGPLALVLDYTARRTACRLQDQWAGSVLSVVQDVRSPVLAYELLYGDRGTVPQFLQGDLRYFVTRDAQSYGPRSALGQSMPFSGQFYAYANAVQARQVAHAETRLHDEQAARVRTSQIETLQQELGELDKQAKAVQALAAAVVIDAEPPLLNPDARQLPQRTSLSLQCASGVTRLDNFNFPSRATFPWAQGQCGDAVLQIQFPNFVLERVYPGAEGFIDFLHEFSSGEHRFQASDFPQQEERLIDAGVQWLVLNWRLQGQRSLVDNVDRLHGIQARQAQINEQLLTLREAQSGVSSQAAQPTWAQDLVPERIVTQCWRSPATAFQEEGPLPPDPAPVAAPPQKHAAQPLAKRPAKPAPRHVPAPSTPSAQELAQQGWRVQVGVFADPGPAMEQLRALGIEAQQRPLPRPGRKDLYQVRSPVYDSREQAQTVAGQIAQALRVKPELVPGDR